MKKTNKDNTYPSEILVEEFLKYVDEEEKDDKIKEHKGERRFY